MYQILVISSLLLWTVVLFNLLLTLALIRRKTIGPGVTRKPKLKEGQSAPPFSARTLNGKTVTLSTYSGQTVALIFILPGCGPCRKVLYSLEALQPYAREANIELVLVSQADVAQTQTFITEHNVTLTTLVAPKDSNSFGDDYKVTGVPFYCLINTKGKVQSTDFLDPECRELIKEWRNKSVTSVQSSVPSLAITERG